MTRSELEEERDNAERILKIAEFSGNQQQVRQCKDLISKINSMLETATN